MTDHERQILVEYGLPFEKIQIVHWPHIWVDNPKVPPVQPEPSIANKPFRFFNISVFLPRRRWDTLIEAYLEEFKHGENVELYLKVVYPSWHPVPGKPKQDLFDLIESLRGKTGSNASIIVDEDLGTRSDIIRLMDSCNVYVSTDTAPTAPVAEARVRKRLVIIPESFDMPPFECPVIIKDDPEAKIPFTPEMLMYLPNHKGT